MVLLVHEINDAFINKLCNFFELENIRYFAINDEDLPNIKVGNFDGHGLIVEVNGEKLNISSDFKYLIVRRVNLFSFNSKYNANDIKYTLTMEHNSMLELVWSYVFKKLRIIWANHYDIKINRIKVLSEAKELGKRNLWKRSSAFNF